MRTVSGPVVCEKTTDKSRDTGPYLHVYAVQLFYKQKLMLKCLPSLILKGKPICIYCHASHYSNN